jgi:hypothetical protein
MEILLVFEGLHVDLHDVVAEIQVDDASLADAPSRALDSSRVGPFALSRSEPSVRIDPPLTVPAGDHEPALVVHVTGRAPDDQPVAFFNTAGTPVPDDPPTPLRVVVSRIR